MQIIRDHGRTKNEAIGIIDNFLNDLMTKQFPGGVKIKNPQKKWKGDVMGFSFKAKKGIAGATISGTVTVFEKDIALNANLPGIVRKFVSEDKIKGVINKQFDELFKN